jgi:hypothetical protein
MIAAMNGDLYRELLAQAPPQAAPQNPKPDDFTLDSLFQEMERVPIIPRMPALMEAIVRERFNRLKKITGRANAQEWESKISQTPTTPWLLS